MRSDLIPLPLGKILVVDATHVVAGPFCSMLLGDAGAEVIKVERPGGERGRRTPPMITDDSGQGVSSRYLTVNRNKKSLTLDLRQPRGKALFEYLVGVSDVVLDNWGPGAMKRLGLDYSRLNAINPSIVYATITGYGDSDALRGPNSGWAANNSSAQAMAGWMEITGQPDRPPQMVGDAIGDTVPGIWTAYGILLALMSRETTGLGQHVDMAMYDCMLAHVTGTVASYQVTGIPPGRNREAMGHPQLSLQALDGYVVLAGAAEEEKWAALWTLIGREDFARDPNYLGRDGTGRLLRQRAAAGAGEVDEGHSQAGPDQAAPEPGLLGVHGAERGRGNGLSPARGQAHVVGVRPPDSGPFLHARQPRQNVIDKRSHSRKASHTRRA